MLLPNPNWALLGDLVKNVLPRLSAEIHLQTLQCASPSGQPYWQGPSQKANCGGETKSSPSKTECFVQSSHSVVMLLPNPNWALLGDLLLNH
jgi:hypothetical protein